jgi:hypothetical protein
LNEDSDKVSHNAKTLVGGCLLIAAYALMAAPADANPTVRKTGCLVRETASWNPSASQRNGRPIAPLRIEAVSSGPKCQRARVVITIKNATGATLHRQTYRSDQVAGLSNARTTSQMRNELRNWITYRGDETYHESLPNWRRGQARPDAREFPFYPADGVTQTQYMAIKTNRTPIYCYVQGIESLNCLVLQGGALNPFGIQSFPG